MASGENLFGQQEPPKIRTLGWWQPFGSLMLHGKVETRIVAAGKKPPFPLGQYLMYTTKKPMLKRDVEIMVGWELQEHIYSTLTKAQEATINLNGYAIAIGTLSEVRPMKEEDEMQCFVPYFTNRWCLIFKDVQRIEPFKFENGKQGIGFATPAEIAKIKIVGDSVPIPVSQ